jgi:amino acid transporter
MLQVQSPAVPVLTEQGLLMATAMVMSIVVVGIVCMTIVVKAHPSLAQEFRQATTLHLLTIMAIVITTSMLGLERILPSEAVASILSGIVGYVLGSARTTSIPARPGEAEYPAPPTSRRP